MLLKDKVAIITGAGSGVGRAACAIFARHGASIMAADVHEESLSETVALLRAEGLTIEPATCDVSDPAAVESVVEKAAARFGRLDVMFNNAGIAARSTATASTTFLDGTLDQFERMSAVNIGGVINGCQSAIRQFRKQGGGGAIVNTSSLAGIWGFGSPIYAATKGAVTALTRSLATDYAADGIRVNAVCPGMMLTPFGVGREGSYTPEIRAWAASVHPLGRVVEPEDCANAALFLASDLAALITGHNLPLDAGMSVGLKLT